MRTIKLVVIGASGVGKTSLRGQYLHNQFSTGYRATIGADFISKTVPHPWNHDENVVLQIWDTAGQERFSSLSAAFFRGADAVMLMFDVNTPKTLNALRKWWDEFRIHAPIRSVEDEDSYCAVVVGNKMDMPVEEDRVDEGQAKEFLHELFPHFQDEQFEETLVSPPIITPVEHERSGSIPILPSTISPSSSSSSHQQLSSRTRTRARTSSQPKRSNLAREKSRSASRSSISQFFHAGANGTMTTTHTSLTIYHTPASSVYEEEFSYFESARTSPNSSLSRAASPSLPWLAPSSPKRKTSIGEMSELTITPCNFHLYQDPRPTRPSKKEKAQALYFTSAKTGVGVSDVFDFVVRRVLGRWEDEEKRMSMREAGEGSTILRLDDYGRQSGKKKAGCCTI